jgi:hypothetical protein
LEQKRLKIVRINQWKYRECLMLKKGLISDMNETLNLTRHRRMVNIFLFFYVSKNKQNKRKCKNYKNSLRFFWNCYYLIKFVTQPRSKWGKWKGKKIVIFIPNNVNVSSGKSQSERMKGKQGKTSCFLKWGENEK